MSNPEVGHDIDDDDDDDDDEGRRGRSGPLPPYAGFGAWSASEERALRVEFRRGSPLDELAALHGRAVHDIRSQLVRLGEFARAPRPTATIVGARAS